MPKDDEKGLASSYRGPKPFTTRAEARAAGAKRYLTGKTCPHGHTVERHVSNGKCTECQRLGNVRRRKENAEKINAYNRDYRAKRKQAALNGTIH